MSQEQHPDRPVTFKDVFGDMVQGDVAAQPVTVEDAALMQSAEMMGLGKTKKGGAASLMQAAADKNVRGHIVDSASHSDAAEEGFGLRETIVDGKVILEEYVGQQPVSEETSFIPTLPEIAATQGITIGEALEEVAVNEPDKLMDKDLARAIQSAEARATGVPISFKGGVGASAQSAAERNAQHGDHITVSDVLDDATENMLVDKVVTPEDLKKLKNVAGGEGGAALVSALQEAVDANAGAERYIEAQQATKQNGSAPVAPLEGEHDDAQGHSPPAPEAAASAPGHVHAD